MTLTPGGTTHRRTLRWQLARVLSVRDETPRARTFRLALPEPRRHLAGQYYVLRLTAPDGYTASRSYSVASPPDDTGEIELTVERLDDGEVSEYLHEVVEPGDELEVRGPIGGFFAWDGESPALLVGGGSGVVPLMAMLRQSRATGRTGLVRMVVSVRSPEDLYYADELPGPDVLVVHTRQAPPGAGRTAGRLALTDVAPLLRGGETVFVCGSPGFADAATSVLQEAGVPVGAIRVERFGPSG
jgi:ferredoxin-NADP reductase